MNLKQFADLGGCMVVRCGAGWGGPYGYSLRDSPRVMMCGFQTRREAREHWLKDTFGGAAGEAVIRLLAESQGMP